MVLHHEALARLIGQIVLRAQLLRDPQGPLKLEYTGRSPNGARLADGDAPIARAARIRPDVVRPCVRSNLVNVASVPRIKGVVPGSAHLAARRDGRGRKRQYEAEKEKGRSIARKRLETHGLPLMAATPRAAGPRPARRRSTGRCRCRTRPVRERGSSTRIRPAALASA